MKDLHEHKDTHREEAKYPCTHARYGCAFKTQGALKAHLKVHENVAYFCDKCEFVSATKAGLQQYKKGNMARVQYVKNVEKCSSGIANWLSTRQAVIREKHYLLTHIVFKCFFPITSTTWM